jgi:hypothetical protein
MSPALQNAVDEGRDELTPAEAEEFANEQTLEYLGMTIAKSRELAAAGHLPQDDPMVVHIALSAGVPLHTC